MALVPLPGPQPSPDPSETPRDRNDVGSAEPLDEGSEASGTKMSFLEHLDELRKRLVISLVSILVGILVAFAFIKYVFEFIMRPLEEILPDSGRLVYTEPTEAFFLYMKMAALAGLLIAFPVVASQVWLFIAPGLYSREKRFAIPFVALATFFFVGGALFSHYLLFPWAWGFFAGFATDYMEFFPRIQPAFSLLREAASRVRPDVPTADTRVLPLARGALSRHSFSSGTPSTPSCSSSSRRRF